MDALSDVLRVVRLSGGVFLEAEFTAPWCISGKVAPEDCQPFLAAPRHVIAFHFVAAGRMQLRAGSDEWKCAGEIVLLLQRRSLSAVNSSSRCLPENRAAAAGGDCAHRARRGRRSHAARVRFSWL
jgi:hypothetical protein